jgi:hypothetical protein
MSDSSGTSAVLARSPSHPQTSLSVIYIPIELNRRQKPTQLTPDHFAHVLVLPHHFGIHSMKCMHAFFLLHAEAAPGVAARMQILLHNFADADIFKLNLVTECHRLFGRQPFVVFLR